MSRTRVAVIFDNLGPYHLARIFAASKRLDILPVQVRRLSLEYHWEASSQNAEIPVQTLLPDAGGLVLRADFSRRLDSVLNALRPDVVAIPGWSSVAAFLAARWCLNNRVPVVLMSESTRNDVPRSAWKEGLKKHFVGLCGSGLVGGRRHAQYLQELGMPANRIALGYDAVDNRYFQENAATVRSSALATRQVAKLPERFFLASNRFIAKKNLTRLLDAYARYRQLAGKDAWHLVLLGDGELRPAIEEKLSSLSVEAYVQLPGFQQYDQLPIYFGLAGAFIHASNTEQWGLVVNEAMASGLPVIVSNRCGCAVDLVQEGVNGFTFEPTDVEQIATLMFQVAAADFPRVDFGLAGQRIISEWGPDRFANGLCVATEMAVANGPPTSTIRSRTLLGLMSRK